MDKASQDRPQREGPRPADLDRADPGQTAPPQAGPVEPAAGPAAGRVTLALVVNGRTRQLSCRPHDSLADALREGLGLTGTKIGCNAGECGACTVLVDGRAVCACLYPAMRARGRQVRTIEGVAEGGRLSAVQAALIRHGAFQCGFCTPGVVMSLTALLEETPRPDETQIRIALQGNVCRCSGYVGLLAAARAAVQGTAEGAP